MSHPFTSFVTEETAILEVTKLLEEHAAAREAAVLEHRANQPPLVEGEAPPTESLPGLTVQDVQRLRKIADLVNGPHRKAVGAVVTKYFPFLVEQEGKPS